jgi:hypothetical protein
MTESVKIENHYQNAVDRLPMQFRDKPVIDSVLATWFGKVQELEDQLFLIKESNHILTASGSHLEKFARLLNIKREFNESDSSLYGRMAVEIIGRSSEASPDSLRKVVEAVTGLTGTNIIEYANVVDWENSGNLRREGATLVFGYYYSSRDRVHGIESDIIRKATPIATGSTVFGKHLNGRGVNSLWIPCEVILEGAPLMVRDSSDNVDNLVDEFGNTFVVSSPNIDRYGENWELGILPEDNIVFDEVFLPSLDDVLGVKTDLSAPIESFNIAETGLGLHGFMLEVYQTNK